MSVVISVTHIFSADGWVLAGLTESALGGGSDPRPGIYRQRWSSVQGQPHGNSREARRRRYSADGDCNVSAPATKSMRRSWTALCSGRCSCCCCCCCCCCHARLALGGEGRECRPATRLSWMQSRVRARG